MKTLATCLLLATTGCGMIKDKLGEKKTPEKAPEPAAGAAPLAPVPVAQALGTETLNAQRCRIQGAEFVGDKTSSLIKAISVSGSNVVLVDAAGALHGFKAAPGAECVLSVDTSFGTNGVLKLPKEINWLSEDAAGNVIASSGIFESYVIRNGQLVHPCASTGHVEVAGDGTWGVAPWVNATVKKVEIRDGACVASEWALKNLSDDAKREGPFSMVGAAAIAGDRVLVGGQLAKNVDPNQAWTVIAFDAKGAEKARLAVLPELASPQHFGWIHSVQGCKQGICAVDSNFRRLSAWTDQGAFVGSVELGKLFGLDYPWIADFDVAADGRAWFVAAQSRPGSETGEGLVYRVQGLGVETAPVAAADPDDEDEDNARPHRITDEVRVVSARQSSSSGGAKKSKSGKTKGKKSKNHR